MAGRVDDDVVAAGVAQRDLRRVDGDALVALGLEGVHAGTPIRTGMPRRADIALIASSLPSGSEPVSWIRRPTSVDLP